jgi:hypothetical protein
MKLLILIVALGLIYFFMWMITKDDDDSPFDGTGLA